MRYTLTHTEDFASVFGISCGDMEDRYNIAPTQEAPVLVVEGDVLACITARWGLVPARKMGDESGKWLANSRAETLDEKANFLDLVEHARCIIPVSGFYEWEGESGTSSPFYFTIPSRPIFGLAGLCNWWADPVSGMLKPTFTIITCPSNDLVGRVHNRMPVILLEEDVTPWLFGPYVPDVLEPYPEAGMEMVQVTESVNNPEYESADCIKKAGGRKGW
ncbi:SOS response-associated peptidase [Methanogenium marinum]|uniref:SOS response-associated peptidase n=1 Tax=Methanogenium marinum TaxID=348610 RepID=A0A9Q4KUJ8_9EURY|nr:SOS response-associated peptidase [Methanogenium marinum]MDE4907521.1 SOS response-associated peptidase [Methanogenium marinum]